MRCVNIIYTKATIAIVAKILRGALSTESTLANATHQKRPSTPNLTHPNSTLLPCPLACCNCLALSARLLLLLSAKALTSVPVPASPGLPTPSLSPSPAPGAGAGGLSPCPDCGEIECAGTRGGGGKFNSESRRCERPAELDMGGGGGTLAMGWLFEGRIGCWALEERR